MQDYLIDRFSKRDLWQLSVCVSPAIRTCGLAFEFGLYCNIFSFIISVSFIKHEMLREMLLSSQLLQNDCYTKPTNVFFGRVCVAWAVSYMPLSAQAWFRSPVSPWGIYGGQSGNGIGFSLSCSAFPCECHHTTVVHALILPGNEQ